LELNTSGQMSRRVDHRQNELDEDEEWLFESIVNFLSSPIWQMSIQHFLETNCTSKDFSFNKNMSLPFVMIIFFLLVFTPNNTWSAGALIDNEESNDETNVPRELSNIHQKYKDLVDALINSFLHDIGISHAKFVRVCKNSKNLEQHPIYMVIF
jgi:hypothetical protein